MRWLYTHPHAARQIGLLGQTHVAKHLSYARIGARMRARLEAHNIEALHPMHRPAPNSTGIDFVNAPAKNLIKANNFIAHYMWNFKPNEKNSIPIACINKNRNFIAGANAVSVADVELLLKKYPGVENFWNEIPHWVIKADLGRLLYVYFNADFYFDVDCIINKSLPNIPGAFFVLFVEKTLSNINELGPRECKNPENALRIANYAFGTNTINHPFLRAVIDECINRLRILINLKPAELQQSDILWVCGPDVITTVYHQTKEQYPDLILLDESYLSHLCYGSWRD
jgi:hypothetical protein